jgi:hypothetical protein
MMSLQGRTKEFIVVIHFRRGDTLMFKTTKPFRIQTAAICGFLLATLIAPIGNAKAQSNVGQTLEARPLAVQRAVAIRIDRPNAQTVAWGRRFYRPGYYGGPARARYYARYPGSYYNPYYNNYGYRGGYYGRPSYYPGYYGYPYGAARVGGLRFYW